MFTEKKREIYKVKKAVVKKKKTGYRHPVKELEPFWFAASIKKISTLVQVVVKQNSQKPKESDGYALNPVNPHHR